MMAAPLLRFKNTLRAPNNYLVSAIARIKDGVSGAALTSDLARIGKEIDAKYPAPGKTFGSNQRIPSVAPLQSAKVDPQSGEHSCFSWQQSVSFS